MPMDPTIVIVLLTSLSGTCASRLESFTNHCSNWTKKTWPEVIWARPSYTGPIPKTLYGFTTDKQVCSEP
jgi:hypothetical protein